MHAHSTLKICLSLLAGALLLLVVSWLVSWYQQPIATEVAVNHIRAGQHDVEVNIFRIDSGKLRGFLFPDSDDENPGIVYWGVKKYWLAGEDEFFVRIKRPDLSRCNTMDKFVDSPCKTIDYGSRYECNISNEYVNASFHLDLPVPLGKYVFGSAGCKDRSRCIVAFFDFLNKDKEGASSVIAGFAVVSS
jgi:hypothetical protein